MRPAGAVRVGLALAGTPDVVVCPWTPHRLASVGSAYADFSATPAEEVTALLRRARGGG